MYNFARQIVVSERKSSKTIYYISLSSLSPNAGQFLTQVVQIRVLSPIQNISVSNIHLLFFIIKYPFIILHSSYVAILLCTTWGLEKKKKVTKYFIIYQ